MSRVPGNTNNKRFPCRKVEGKWLCRMCGTELAGRKTSFCGLRCLRDFFMLTDWTRVRKVIFARDGGICMKCGQRPMPAFVSRGSRPLDGNTAFAESCQ